MRPLPSSDWLAKVERGVARRLAFITEGDGDPGSVAATLRDLEARKRDLEARLAAADAPAVEIHPNVAELYRRRAGELRTLLEGEETRLEAMEIVRGLVERIEVRPGAKRGRPEVALVGALASLLDFACSERKAAAGAGADGGRVLLVAGAGFEPATFRL